MACLKNEWVHRVPSHHVCTNKTVVLDRRGDENKEEELKKYIWGLSRHATERKRERFNLTELIGLPVTVASLAY